MTTAIATQLFGPNNGFWDVVYSATVLVLGVVASVAIYLEISGL
jgi:hypothetical protein